MLAYPLESPLSNRYFLTIVPLKLHNSFTVLVPILTAGTMLPNGSAAPAPCDHPPAVPRNGLTPTRASPSEGLAVPLPTIPAPSEPFQNVLAPHSLNESVEESLPNNGSSLPPPIPPLVDSGCCMRGRIHATESGRHVCKGVWAASQDDHSVSELTSRFEFSLEGAGAREVSGAFRSCFCGLDNTCMHKDVLCFDFSGTSRWYISRLLLDADS